MEWWFYMPVAFWALFALVLGLMVGSFLNVLIARLPYEKSILWPGSRCFSCYRPIRVWDNLPILGYLLLRGRCRSCGAPFSSRYLWVELGTGLAFLGLFVLEVLVNPAGLPGVKFAVVGGQGVPPPPAIAMFVYHACLLSLLIAAAAIDAEHRIIPPLIPYTGALIGIVGGALMPWPWPHPNAGAMPQDRPWFMMDLWGQIPVGVQPWPFWGPLFDALPAGSWKLGLVNSLVGALAGSLTVRVVKWVFELGIGREALGLGDADLMMMAGAFLGWQIAVLSLFTGAVAGLVVFKLPGLLLSLVRGGGFDRELAFGPGLAVGVVVTWLAWPWIGPSVQFVFFDTYILVMVAVLMAVGMLASGLLIRRRVNPEPQAAG